MSVTAHKQLENSGLPMTASGVEVAEILGVTPRRLRQLVAEGYVEGKLGRDEYDTLRAISTYLSYCRNLKR